jgi:hypothetical protein
MIDEGERFGMKVTRIGDAGKSVDGVSDFKSW